MPTGGTRPLDQTQRPHPGRARRPRGGVRQASTWDEQIPFGQTVLVGHHTENRVRRNAQRIHAAPTLRGNRTPRPGRRGRHRQPVPPVTVANRIQRLTAERNRITRSQDGDTRRTIAVLPDGTRRSTTTAAAAQHRDRELLQHGLHDRGRGFVWVLVPPQQAVRRLLGQEPAPAGEQVREIHRMPTRCQIHDAVHPQDPQLARIYYTQMVERGAEHLKALCVVAGALAERAWTVMNRQMPYVICDIDGTPVTPEQAKRIIAQNFTVPDEVRRRRRSSKTPSRKPHQQPTIGGKGGRPLSKPHTAA